jgi:outer membrane protein OmpA-like peptidoglycan-associated protein
MRNNDDLQVRLLLEEAEAAAWLEGASDRNRLLLEIDARRAELAGKRAREALALSESAQQAARAAADRAKQTEARGDQLETKPPAPETKSTPPDRVVTLGDVVFDSGSAVLRPEAGPIIDRLAEFLRAHPQRSVLIEGFTDSAGSDKHNFRLSERRANAVRQALVNRGVAVERITLRAYGSAHPVASNSNKAGRQQNRRVEIVISDAEGRIPNRRASRSK